MPQLALKIPESQWANIKRFLKVSIEDLALIVEYVKAASPSPDLEDLVESCAHETHLDSTLIEAVFSMGISLSRLQRSADKPEAEIFNLIEETLVRSNFPEWEEKYSQAWKERQPILVELLISDGALEVMSEVRELLYDFHCFTLPYELKYLRNTVEKSRWMLDLQDNWDDEGSLAYSESTWRRAVTFLLKNALALWQEQQVLITEPAIHNGPEGSIDIHWGSDNRKLLINIPTNTDEPTNFYGYDLTGIEVRGTLNLSDSNKWLLLWQME